MRSSRLNTEQYANTNGVSLRIIEAKDRNTPVVVLAHDFHELVYSCRNQIPTFTKRATTSWLPNSVGYSGSVSSGCVRDLHHP